MITKEYIIRKILTYFNHTIDFELQTFCDFFLSSQFLDLELLSFSLLLLIDRLVNQEV